MITLLLFFLLLSFLTGTMLSVSLAPGVHVYFQDIFVVMICLFGITNGALKKSNISPLVQSILLFVCVAFISLLVNVDRFSGTQIIHAGLYTIRFFAYALLYVILKTYATQSRFILHWLYGVGSAFSILGFFQLYLYPDLRNVWYAGWDPHYYRLFSSFLDPNYAGIFIVLTILLGFLLHKHFIVQMILVLALYFTYSRASYLAFLIGLTVWVIQKKKWGYLFVGLALVIGIVSIPTPGGDTLKLLRVDSSVARLENWSEAYDLFLTSPILGHGFNTLRFISRQQGAVEGYPLSRSIGGVDNSVLFLLVTVGIIGTLAYGIVFYRMYKTAPFLVSCFGATLVHSMFTNTLFYPWIMLWWWLALAASDRPTSRT